MVSTELLLRVAQATPEQQAAIEQFLLHGSFGAAAESRRPARAFQKVGSHWRVVFESGGDFHIEDTLGARYLDYLLHHSNVPISAYDLEATINLEKASARPRDSIQTNVDAEAARQYLKELQRLRAEREEAEDSGDLGLADRVDAEIEAFEKALKGGSASTDAGERARGNVSKAIAAVRRKLAKGTTEERSFAEHIQRFVSTGYECLYSQETGKEWQ